MGGKEGGRVKGKGEGEKEGEGKDPTAFWEKSNPECKTSVEVIKLVQCTKIYKKCL